MSQEILFVKLGKDSKLSSALLTELNLLKEQRTGTSLATPQFHLAPIPHQACYKCLPFTV